ncbi:MAG: hypothetical protein U5N55_11930 [Cypionkella sp.]|nr:hypothetical protein [Cypionkella sp.]
MTDTSDLIARAKASLQGVTEGPWVYEFRSDGSGFLCMGDVQQWQQHKQFDIDLHRDDGNDPDDLAFIAACPPACA